MDSREFPLHCNLPLNIMCLNQAPQLKVEIIDSDSNENFSNPESSEQSQGLTLVTQDSKET